MFDYYCKNCDKFCDFQSEIEFKEGYYEGDWEEVHVLCGSRVIVSLSFREIQERVNQNASSDN